MSSPHSIALGILAGLAPALAIASGPFTQLTPIGLSEVRAQWLEIAEPAPHTFDRFGEAVAAGDFNGDGADDLAVGVVSGADPISCPGLSCGFVAVRYGAVGGGLVDPEFTILTKPFGTAQSYDRYGDALAAADFNDDGFADLAVGISGSAPAARGAVMIHYGGVGGLSVAVSHFLNEETAGEPAHQCDATRFGEALAAGDFNGDEFADLAVGAPFACDTILGGPLISGGSVFVFHGAASGLLPFVGYRMSQNSFGIDPVEANDEFGAALAAGDFDASGHDDLAIGAAYESAHGAIEIVMGSQFGLLFASHAFWAPGALGELPEIGDRLGGALASADFDHDGHADLAVGNPFEDLPDPGNGIQDVGAVDIAYGSPAWFDLGRTDQVTQTGIFDFATQNGAYDYFGAAFAAGDFDGDGFADLAVSSPWDSWAGISNGGVSVLMGSAGQLGATMRFRFLAAGEEGIPGSADQNSQNAGFALAAGDFDGNGFADLAIGVPCYSGPATCSGAVAVLYGALFADGFEAGLLGRWSSSTS